MACIYRQGVVGCVGVNECGCGGQWIVEKQYTTITQENTHTPKQHNNPNEAYFYASLPKQTENQVNRPYM